MEPRERLRVAIQGAVQGVGFRPFVHRLASEFGLAGWVTNTPEGLLLEAEGSPEGVRRFLARLGDEKPVHAVVQNWEPTFLEPAGYEGFSIKESVQEGAKTTLAMPDLATCGVCLSEIFHPANRRYRYPFTNCTHCGPRYSLMEGLPYDRKRTTMRLFRMCPDCEWEYHNPQDRRFHAEPTACPSCGPHLELWNAHGKVLASGTRAMDLAQEAIRKGLVIAVKGLGGFQLCVDGRNEAAVQMLRKRKNRGDKPFALMVASLAEARILCQVSDLEARLLQSPEAPIVILRHNGPAVASSVAPGNPHLGVMLPYTPLHHLFLQNLDFPIVATSGNRSEEPICIDEHQALLELAGLADLFLVHNRPITRPVDDSVVTVVEGRELLLRRARGYAPLPIHCRFNMPPLVAVGGHLKNSVALAIGQELFLSQHIGDLQTARAFDTFKETVQSLSSMYDFKPEAAARDLHPNYVTTRYAESVGCPVVAVQHHYAHVRACMTDNDLEGPLLGIAWDGTGFGLDHTVWGGEFLRVTDDGFERVAHLRTFRLPGNEKAVREPRRSAVGVLYEMMGEALFEDFTLAPLRSFSLPERDLLRSMLQRGIQAPLTSSAGRLFDALASILELRQISSFEGQAAMDLEFAAMAHPSKRVYPIRKTDWEPMMREILDDIAQRIPAGAIAAAFHNTLVEMIVQAALDSGEKHIVLTGGCFQNRLLLANAIRRLREAGLEPYWHRRVPPNDGGIAVGQIVAAADVLRRERKNYVFSGAR